MFQSEIRESQLTDLFEKVRNRHYGQFLLRMVINKARAITDKAIDFEFPVTAIVGPNGGGKTTIVGAAAILYKNIAPSNFFAKSGAYDASMQNWKIEYEAIDKSLKPNDTLRRTAKYHNLKWARNTLDRDVLVFGVSRTVPAAERKELRRCVSNSFEVSPERVEDLSDVVAESVTKILDKDVSKFKNIKIDESGNVTLLSGVNNSGDSFSEFHFGAGESSIIRMVLQLETAKDNALVIIEEIENGLHPIATIRMVEYLIDLAERKKIQALFTTHSNDALKPLPSRAIWASVGGELYQGKLDIKSLRAINGQINSELVVFAEDEFASLWLQHIFGNFPSVALDAISFHSMRGDGTAVKVHKNREVDPSIAQPSICFLDGDSRETNNENENIFRLPGQCPESTVFDHVYENLDRISGELAVTLLKPYEFESKLKGLMDSVRNTNRDPHLLFAQFGKKLGLIPEERVKEAFLAIWCRLNNQYIQDLFEQISSLVPTEGDTVDLKSVAR